MTHQFTLIDLAKLQGGFRTFADLARASGIEPKQLLRCRKSEVALSEAEIRTLAGHAGVDAERWVGLIMAEHAARRRRFPGRR